MIHKLSIEKAGFCPILETEKFKCAFITIDDQYRHGKVTRMKRHNDSDEIFTLIRGSAVLLTLEKEFAETPLELGASFMVPANTWHYLAISEDAIVFVTENSGMLPQNTDTLTLETPYEI